MSSYDVRNEERRLAIEFRSIRMMIADGLMPGQRKKGKKNHALAENGGEERE